MKCKKCGSQIQNGKKFCTKCGAKIDNVSDIYIDNKKITKKELRKNNKATKKAAKKAAKKEKWKSLSFGAKMKKICLRTLAVVLAVIILASGAITALVYYDIIDIPVVAKILDVFGVKETKDSNDNTAESTDSIHEDKLNELEELDKEIEKALGELGDTQIDANAYFHDNSNVVSEIEVNVSNSIHTEAEAYNNIIGRGFTEYPIETGYSMNGEYGEPANISDTSSTKHPLYQTVYVADNGNVWSISEINGVIMADPVSYNTQSKLGVQLIISETETVTSYDSRTNKFYETIPNESELIVKTIDRIDAETLEKLTFGEIDKL